jgi:hypothetical protein
LKVPNNILAIDLEARKRRVYGQREAPFGNDRSLRGTAADDSTRSLQNAKVDVEVGGKGHSPL